MATSRSPLPYLRRKGKLPIVEQPGPRFDPSALLVNNLPTEQTECKAKLAEGSPAPDRPLLVDLNPSTEE